MSDIHYKVELRREYPEQQRTRLAGNWQESWIFPTLEEANDRIVWWLQYDEYYSLTGWEYRIVEVKARKKK